jgi:2-oxoglutarate dehydrogenase E1 component
VIAKYKNAEDIVWAQEEPKNMGAYSFLLLHMPETINWRLCSTDMFAAPATGSSTRAKDRMADTINQVFNNKK